MSQTKRHFVSLACSLVLLAVVGCAFVSNPQVLNPWNKLGQFYGDAWKTYVPVLLVGIVSFVNALMGIAAEE